MGIGTAYLIAAQLTFVFSNYFLHIGLARYLGPALYGIFGVIISIYTINRALLNTGIPRAVSKLIAESKKNVKAIIKSSFKIQIILSIIMALFYVFFAKFLAKILNDIETQLTSNFEAIRNKLLPKTVKGGKYEDVLKEFYDNYLGGAFDFKTKHGIMDINLTTDSIFKKSEN